MNTPTNTVFVVAGISFFDRAEAVADRDAMIAEGYNVEIEEFEDDSRSPHNWDMYLRGCDDHNTIRAEMEDIAHESNVRFQDEMIARGGPVFGACVEFTDEIPF